MRDGRRDGLSVKPRRAFEGHNRNKHKAYLSPSKEYKGHFDVPYVSGKACGRRTTPCTIP